MMRAFLLFWSALWTVSLPLIRGYLRKRAKKDPLYAQHLPERFGRYENPRKGAVWFHAVSLGEVRSAVPLMRAMLEAGEHLLITCFTPAGRREAEKVFAGEAVQVVWVPLELERCFKRFFQAFAPKLGLVMEVEIWPRMVQSARDHGVPLLMCNAGYPLNSMMRDRGFPLRPAVMRRFAGALVKSELQRERFREVGVEPIFVTGELRFDQPIPPAHPEKGAAALAALANGRPVIGLASIVEGEEELILSAIARALTELTPRPLIVLVPRAPERFAPVAEALVEMGINFARRSELFDKDLTLKAPADIDLLLGDSIGEMYFYLSMTDRVLVGGGFTPKGSHNIIEPLALGKPVVVGPDISTIEYPAVEAIRAGVCLQVGPDQVLRAFSAEGWAGPTPDQITAFLAEHSGGTRRAMEALQPWLQR